MAKSTKDINIRSEEIQDLMVKKPAWIVRWGISTIFVIIFVMLIFTWVMKYPDIIYGRVVLTAEKPALKVVSRVNGKIQTLYIQDSQAVRAGDILAEIENPISLHVIHYAESYIKQLEAQLKNPSAQLIPPDTNNFNFGELQSRVNDMRNDIALINMRRKHDLEQLSITKLSERIANHRDLIVISKNLLEIESREMANAEVRYKADKQLYADSVLSVHEFIRNETEFHKKQQEFNQRKMGIIEYKLALNNMEVELETMKYNRSQLLNSDFERMNGHKDFLLNFINTWKQNFALVAPADGYVTYLRPLASGQFINQGESYFAIVQNNSELIGWIDVPSSGYGKIEIGQKVNVRLDNFPFNEFGMLQGKVVSLARVPDKERYTVGVVFPDGLTTSYKQKLDFSPEMLGSAEILTRERRLIQRIFDSIIKLINRSHQPEEIV